MTTATISSPPAVDRILASYAAQAGPALNRLAGISEEVAGALSRFTNPESAAKQATSVIDPALFRERTVLGMDLGTYDRKARAEFSAWLNQQRASLERARAIDPELETNEGQNRKLMMLAEADSLSRLPGGDLLAEGHRLAGQGDARGAQVRLNAARLGGLNAPGRLRQLREAIDKVLDQEQPHRIAAVQQLKAAERAYRDALTMVVRTQVLADMLGKANPTQPEAVVAKVRAHAADLARLAGGAA